MLSAASAATAASAPVSSSSASSSNATTPGHPDPKSASSQKWSKSSEAAAAASAAAVDKKASWEINDWSFDSHSVSQPIPMQKKLAMNSLAEPNGCLLSPKSTDNVGLNLVNSILAEEHSPSVRELETRFKNVKLIENAKKSDAASAAAAQSAHYDHEQPVHYP
ncbi:hypothetical protein BpHYR1_011146, partial [Brachionus plicatilis]